MNFAGEKEDKKFVINRWFDELLWWVDAPDWAAVTEELLRDIP